MLHFCNSMLAAAAVLLCSNCLAADPARQRAAMIQTIASHVRATREYLDKEALDERVLEVMGRVERHRFVPEAARSAAYDNRPLPIGHGQTISQPYIVAIMTDLLELEPDDRVLEIGTGSGYQAAVLAELVAQVYTVEIIEPLADSARERLDTLGYDNVSVRLGDGYDGWSEHAPFDAIIVTAGAPHIPPPLIRQLRSGGRLIIPVGSRFAAQQLVVVEKRPDGTLRTRQIMPVLFVPLTGKHGE